LRGTIVSVIGALSVAVHPSHFVFAGFLFLALIALRLTSRLFARARPFKPQLFAPAIVCAAGLLLVIAANFDFTRQVFVSRAGAPFLFARMLQDGIVMRLLDDTCPKSGYRLCAYKEQLPPTADGYLWTPRSPFFALGHFQGTATESAKIVHDAILRYPLMQLRAALADSATQFVEFGTGEGMEPQQWILGPVFMHLIPQQMPDYLAARQQGGALNFRLISKGQIVIGFVSLVALIGILAWATRAKWGSTAALPLFVLAALVGNAIICGVLSGPHDRYQSRLMWLAPFAVMLCLARAGRIRQ
jgi:hypothetical protein